MLGSHSKAFGGGPPAAGVSLNLTALMDILSNLLFFLLASYTVQELEVKTKDKISLPSSTSEAKIAPNLKVSISRSQIAVADVPVARIDGEKVLDTVEGDKIVGLYDRLKMAKAARAAAGSESGGMAMDETILLLADKTTDASVITKTLKTAGMAGFVNVRFAVLPQ
jgi:biopolymer transport protein ExbD